MYMWDILGPLTTPMIRGSISGIPGHLIQHPPNPNPNGHPAVGHGIGNCNEVMQDT